MVEQPLYVRVTNTTDDAAVFFRLLVVAEEGSQATLIEEYTSASQETTGYSNAVAELFVEQAAQLEYVSLQNLSMETWHFATHHAPSAATRNSTGSPAASARRRARSDPERPRRPGRRGRVTGAYFADGDQHLDYDTFQEHIAPSTTSDFAFKARCATERLRCGAE